MHSGCTQGPTPVNAEVGSLSQVLTKARIEWDNAPVDSVVNADLLDSVSGFVERITVPGATETGDWLTSLTPGRTYIARLQTFLGGESSKQAFSNTIVAT